MNCLSKKNITALCFIGFYAVTLALNVSADFTAVFSNFKYAVIFLITYLLPLIPPILIIIFLLPLCNNCTVKKWLVPSAFVVKFVYIFISLCSSFAVIGSIFSLPLYFAVFICSFLTFIATAVMFVGTLFDFKYIKLLKYGALCCVVLTIASQILSFVAVGGINYLQSVPEGYAAVNLAELVSSICSILFYIGIIIADFKQKS